MPYRTDKMIELAILDDSVEVSVLGSLLEEKGIRYLLEPLGSSPYAGIFETQKGQARLKVFESDARAAREVLENFYEAPRLEDPDFEERDFIE